MLSLWELLSDERFESDSCTLLRKLDFFFGDSSDEDVEVLYDIQMASQIKNRRFFLPNI